MDELLQMVRPWGFSLKDFCKDNKGKREDYKGNGMICREYEEGDVRPLRFEDDPLAASASALAKENQDQ
ncbi:uncharacterized protein G2W53_001071 [Senna tora]|uniref:Uncharacterized protein n=1 Tax=Senna tora TaxID=362788 RepID=A0A835CIA4_9FABA|nr:uncharacterized protein G2W53_001071 [Senna tora]